MIKVIIDKYTYSIEIIDSTHCKFYIDEFKTENSNASVLHVLQLSDSLKKELQKIKKLNEKGNSFYVESN